MQPPRPQCPLRPPRHRARRANCCPKAELNALLTGVALSDLDTAQLAHYLAGLHGIGALASLHVLLPLPSELGVAGLEQGLNEAIMQLAEAARLESREATLGELLNPGDLLPKLMGKLNSQLALLGLALGESEEKSLTKALGSLDLDQLVGSLLSTTKEPAQLTGLSNLAGGLFEEIGPGSVKGLLGSTLGGKFQPTTVEAVAEELGSSSEAVSGELGETAAQLPAGATMLTAPLTKGGVMGIAPAAKGLALGLLRSVSSEGTSGESGKEAPGATARAAERRLWDRQRLGGLRRFRRR